MPAQKPTKGVWFFPQLDPAPRSLPKLVCPKDGPVKVLRLEEGPFDLPTAQLAWSVELNGRKVKTGALLLERPPKSRPAGKRKIRAVCGDCGKDLLGPVQELLVAKGATSHVPPAPASAARGVKKPPFDVPLDEHAGAACAACGKQDRIVFRPASRYSVYDAILRSDIAMDARGTLTLPAAAEIAQARRMEVAGTLEEISATCGHCGKPFPRFIAAAKAKGKAAPKKPGNSESDALAHEAQAHFEAGRFDVAVEAARRVLETHRKNPRALLVLALASMRQRNYTVAIPTLLELKRVDKKFAAENDVDAWLGACYEAQGQLSDAATSFRNRLKSRPRDPSATLALARVLLLRDGPTGQGLKLLKEVARIPLARDRALVDPRLAPLRAHPAVRAALGLA